MIKGKKVHWTEYGRNQAQAYNHTLPIKGHKMLLTPSKEVGQYVRIVPNQESLFETLGLWFFIWSQII